MMKTHLGLLLSTVAGMAMLNVAHAAPLAPSPSDISPAQSYSDLLEPVHNATALIAADDIARADAPGALFQLVQDRNHHHHHQSHHHHHHHRYNEGGGPGFYFGFGNGFGYGEPNYYYGGDCHWAWGRRYWNGWRWVHERVRVCD